LSTPSQNQLAEVLAPVSQSEQRKGQKPRTVYNCDFRSAGRLSNDDARSLTAMHEGIAQHVSSALDAYLGTSCEVKLDALDQLSIKDHLADLPAHCHVVPFASNSVFVEFDNELIFPIIELLLGGAGDAKDPGRILSEIEEEIMQDIVLLVWQQAVSTWRIADTHLDAGPRINASEMQQAFGINEKATVFRFGVQLGSVASSFRLVLSTEFINTLLKQIKLDRPQTKSRVRSFPMAPLRERILDCDFEVTAELPSLKVQVRDLIALQPGSVLKLHAPIRNLGMLTAGGHGMFEAAPVRIGSQRAAQLGRSVRPVNENGR
jgi:flagellar motor switch protein FliM